MLTAERKYSGVTFRDKNPDRGGRCVAGFTSVVSLVSLPRLLEYQSADSPITGLCVCVNLHTSLLVVVHHTVIMEPKHVLGRDGGQF